MQLPRGGPLDILNPSKAFDSQWEFVRAGAEPVEQRSRVIRCRCNSKNNGTPRSPAEDTTVFSDRGILCVHLARVRSFLDCSWIATYRLSSDVRQRGEIIATLFAYNRSDNPMTGRAFFLPFLHFVLLAETRYVAVLPSSCRGEIHRCLF